MPDFGVPEGVVAPATIRQHMMMVGTARTAVRSPQVQFTLCDAIIGFEVDFLRGQFTRT